MADPPTVNAWDTTVLLQFFFFMILFDSILRKLSNQNYKVNLIIY